MDVNKKVELLINYRLNPDNTPFDKEYQDTFEGEGTRKSKFILDALSTNQEASKENLSKYIFVSIGGADGSEAEEILTKTEIKKSIMVEISDNASAKARERALKLKNTLGKELLIIQGDVTQKLPDVIKHMKQFKKKDHLTGMILSIQAVIHELNRRSPNHRDSALFGQLFSVFSKNIYFGREPIKPEGWPDIVLVKVGNASSENLSNLAEIINDKLSITKVPVTPVANDFIIVDSTLAIELLHKLIRPESVSQFAYELGEQLTSLDPVKLRKTIESHLGTATVIIEPTITEGFKEAWKRYSVKAKNELGEPLSYPNTHAKFVGFSLASGIYETNVSRDITVDCSGYGDVETIHEAIEIAKDGDKITILPGIYKESLDIEKDVDIIGYGDIPSKVIIESSDNSCIHLNAAALSIKNLIIHQINNNYKNNCAINISSGNPRIQQCKIISESLYGIIISETAAPVIYDCEIQLKQIGFGISILENAHPLIQQCKIHDSHTGLLILSSANLRIEGNNIWSTKIGVRIDEDSCPIIKNNVIHDTEVGILVRENGNGSILENDISKHAACAIEIRSGANPIIVGNNLHDGIGDSVGIFIRDNALPRIEENTIDGNLHVGVL